MTQQRILKVSQTTKTNRPRFLSTPRTVKFIPKIKLEGDWLHDAGFSIGDFVTVSISGNTIQITTNPDRQ